MITQDVRLIPGAISPEDTSPYDDVGSIQWQPSGLADGIAYLGEKRIVQPSGQELIIYPSAERRALAYLRPLSAEFKRLNPQLSYGISKPQYVTIPYPNELWKLAKDQNRPIHFMFSADSPALRELNSTNFSQLFTVHQVEGEICVMLSCGV